MTHVLNVAETLHPNHLVVSAIRDACPDDRIVLRPEIVDGLADMFTVIFEGSAMDGVQYFVGLYGEHDLDSETFNPLNMNPLVLGVQLIGGQLTVANTLSVDDGKNAVDAANVLMLVQYGEELTTDQQTPKDPDHEDWIVQLEEYTQRVVCRRLATIDYEDNTFYFYVGSSRVNEVTEHFLLVVQIIGDESFSLRTDDEELWTALFAALLDLYGIEFQDGGDNADESDDDESGVDLNVC